MKLYGKQENETLWKIRKNGGNQKDIFFIWQWLLIPAR